MKKKFSTKDIVFIGLLAALNYLSVLFFNIPFGTGAMVHLGAAILFSTSIAFGGLYGGAGGGIGNCIVDITSPYALYAPFTLVIKFLTGFFIGKLCDTEHLTVPRTIFACIVGSAITLLGYMVAWTIIEGSVIIAMANVPSSILTSVIGIVVGVPLGFLLRKLRRYM